MEQARISSSQGTQAPQTTRNRQGSDAAGAAASPGSFLALLSAQDDVVAPGAVMGEAAGSAVNAGGEIAGATSDAAPEVADALAVLAWQGVLTPDAVDQPPASAVRGSGVLEERASAGGAALSGWGGGDGALLSGAALRQGLVAETAQLDGASDLKESGLQGPASGYGRILSRMQTALGQRASNAGSGGLSDSAVGRSALGGVSLHAATTSQVFANAFQSAGEHAAVVTAQSSGAQSERHGGLGSPAVAFDSLTAGAGGLVAGTVSGRGGDPSGGGRSGDGQAGGGGWSDGTAASAPLEGGSADGASMFADPTQAGAEEFVTDSMAYWVNQKTQNAELTLDRDGQPVEVSVSLSGNEAHVTFRSDQSETRELLDRSMAQLGDLLREEGLVLSGTSVGTSARDGAGAGDPGQPRREGARQGQVTSSAPAGAAAQPRAAGASDRAVDVFV